MGLVRVSGSTANPPSLTGFTPVQYTVRDGVRASTSESFLRPVSHKKNLFVLTNAMVTKVCGTNLHRPLIALKSSFIESVYD